jgi:glucose/arabinose dehydrogenase
MNSSFKLLIVLLLGPVSSALCQISFYEIEDDPINLVAEVVADSLDLPWDLVWTDEGEIWFTERTGLIRRLDPQSRELSDIHFVDQVYTSEDNSGLHAMALHYDFANQPWVYIVYTFGPDDLRLSRLQYDAVNDTMHSEETLLELDGKQSHNGARLIWDQTQKLLFATGDAFNPFLPQDSSSINGKILRMNDDATVPDDNPFPGNLMYSLGHRNPQGLTQLPNGIIWSSEHGQDSDDELNRIIEGANYGWPEVAGFCDDSIEMLWCEDLNVVEPALAWTPTPAPAGLDYYDHPAIPQWRNSLLQAFLKRNGDPGQRLRQIKLSADGLEVVYQKDYLHLGPILTTDLDRLNQTGVFGRLRDVMTAPDGSVYICTSNREFNGRYVETPADDRIIRIYNPNWSEVACEEGCILLYPNPGDGQALFLKLGEQWEGQTQLSVYQINGQLMMQTEIEASNFVSVELPQLAEGQYVIKLISSTGLEESQLFQVGP